MAKISVIIPVYGVEKYIERCARSLFEQTLDDIEYLFIDDCTADRSIEILNCVLEEYPQRKSQVVIHRMEQNSGQAAVRKWGLYNSTGDYITHCDSDDWIDKQFCEKLYNKAIEDGADIVICDYYTIDANGSRKYVQATNRNVINQDFFRNVLLQNVGASVWNKLIRRDLILPEELIYACANMGEDYVLTIQYAYHAKHISVVNEALYYYFFNTDSITKTVSKDKVYYRFVQSVKNMDAVIEFMESINLREEYEDELDRMKLYKRNNILPIIYEQKYYKLWKSTFPEINIRILWNKYISLYEKIKYLLALFRIKRHWS